MASAAVRDTRPTIFIRLSWRRRTSYHPRMTAPQPTSGAWKDWLLLAAVACVGIGVSVWATDADDRYVGLGTWGVLILASIGFIYRQHHRRRATKR